jgi:hypothetical protein
MKNKSSGMVEFVLVEGVWKLSRKGKDSGFDNKLCEK